MLLKDCSIGKLLGGSTGGLMGVSFGSIVGFSEGIIVGASLDGLVIGSSGLVISFFAPFKFSPAVIFLMVKLKIIFLI